MSRCPTNSMNFEGRRLEISHRVRAFGAHATAYIFYNIHFSATVLCLLESPWSHLFVDTRILMLRRLRAEILAITYKKLWHFTKFCPFFDSNFSQILSLVVGHLNMICLANKGTNPGIQANWHRKKDIAHLISEFRSKMLHLNGQIVRDQ